MKRRDAGLDFHFEALQIRICVINRSEGMQHHLAEQQQVLDKYRDFTQGGGCGEGGPPASADQSAAG